MNNKGFTLIEVLSVIVLLGLLVGIAVPNVMRGNKKAKERTLLSKIENIEKAAVLYGQDNRDKISIYVDGKDSNGEYLEDEALIEYKEKYKYCYKEGNDKPISNCYYYSEDETNPSIITVDFLATAVQGYDEDGNALIGYVEYDDKVNKIIKNPTDESKNMNYCQIQIYQKYGKIYAVYDKEYKDATKTNMKCWVD